MAKYHLNCFKLDIVGDICDINQLKQGFWGVVEAVD
jgi:hypothetical protein